MSRRFDLRSVPGLVSWIQPASDTVTLVSGKISAIADRSGNGLGVTQAVAAQRPVSVAGGAGSNLRGRCGDGTIASQLSFASGVFSGLTEAEAFIVFLRTTDPTTTGDGQGGLWHIAADAVNSLVPFSDGTIYDGFGSTARKATTVSAAGKTKVAPACIYNVSSGAGVWTARLNGTQIYTTATNTFGMSATACLLADSATPLAVFMTGYFDLFAMYNHILTVPQRAIVEADIRAEFKITA